MAERPKRTRSLTGTRERIVDLIRRAPRTAREIAADLSLTYHAVRQHLLVLEHDGVIRVAGVRGATRPASVYDIDPGVESSLSRAYVPFAAHLTRVLQERLPQRQIAGIMREVGQRLAGSFPRPLGSLRERALGAAAILQDLGSPNEVVGRGSTLMIRSSSCLLGAVIHGRPEVCQAMAAFLGVLLDADVTQRCERGDRPRCCFEVRRAG